MKTAAFANYTGPGRILIARFAPRRTPAGFRIYRDLAPGSWFNSVSKAEYRNLFFEQLSRLDPQKVVADLERLANGVEPVLMCYEVPPLHEGNWCHRTFISEWLLSELGLVVEELDECT